jgi:hypothetical protein
MTAWRLKTIADLPNTPGSSKDDGLHFELMAGLSAEGRSAGALQSERLSERLTKFEGFEEPVIEGSN